MGERLPRCKNCGSVIRQRESDNLWIHLYGGTYCIDAAGFTATPLALAEPEIDPDPDAPFLTDLERDTIRQVGGIWGDLCTIVGNGPTRDADLNELLAHVHAIQHTIMAQAAARAFPDEFRLLGSTL